MFSPTTVLFSINNLRSLARAAVPTCDTRMLVGEPLSEGLGPTWSLKGFLAHVSGACPQVSVYEDDNDNGVVIIAGVGSFGDFTRVTDGALSPSTYPFEAGKYNSYTLVWLNAVVTFLNGVRAAPWRTLMVVGHSLGGTVAPMLARKVQREREAGSVACFTMGAPRFCTGLGAEALSTVPLLRLMNTGDIVPIVPPKLHDAPVLWATLLPSQALAFSQLVHLAGGATFGPLGQIEAAERPSGINLILNLQLGILWELFSSANIPNHFVANYLTALDKLAPTVQEPRLHNVPMAAVPEQPLRGHALADVMDQAREVHRQLGALGVRVPANQSARIVRVIKRDRQYYVTIGGENVYSATGKRDARAVARSIRHFAIQYYQHPELFPDATRISTALDAAIL